VARGVGVCGVIAKLASRRSKVLKASCSSDERWKSWTDLSPVVIWVVIFMWGQNVRSDHLLLYEGEGSSHGALPLLHLLIHLISRGRSSHLCFGERFGRTREGLSVVALCSWAYRHPIFVWWLKWLVTEYIDAIESQISCSSLSPFSMCWNSFLLPFSELFSCDFRAPFVAMFWGLFVVDLGAKFLWDLTVARPS